MLERSSPSPLGHAPVQLSPVTASQMLVLLETDPSPDGMPPKDCSQALETCGIAPPEVSFSGVPIGSSRWVLSVPSYRIPCALS